MVSTRAGGWMALLLGAVCACGGRAEGSPAGDPAAVGGSAGTSGSTSVAGAGATPMLVAPEQPVSTPGLGATTNACDWPPLTCTDRFSLITIVDGGEQALQYPSDASCGSAGVRCEDCELSYQLWALAESSCGAFQVKVSACATEQGDPPCLNTAAPQPYYLDASGKRWQVDALGGQGELSRDAAHLEGKLTLSIHDDAGLRRTLPVEVSVCAAISALLHICK